MSNLTCTMANCQTTAGCQCARVAYQAHFDRVNRATDREIDEACRALQPITGYLDKPARVGNVVFRKGVSVSTVIEAAQRLYAASPTPQERVEAIGWRTLWADGNYATTYNPKIRDHWVEAGHLPEPEPLYLHPQTPPETRVGGTEAQRRVYNILAEQGGGTWAIYTMMEIEAAFENSPASNVGAIVPPHCTGYSFVLDPGVMHVRKDGSGYIVVDENDFVLEDDRGEGPDGPEGSIHWIARMGPREITALRNFLNGAPQDRGDGEKMRLRQIISDSASALGNGAFIAPQASVEFMEGLPKEISLVVSSLRQPRVEDIQAEIASVVQSVNEWDDRTSPDDYPDHLLITSEELTLILRNFAASIAITNMEKI